MMRIIFYIAVILGFGLGSCQDKDDSGPSDVSSRTVIVYLGVDNNFSGEDDEKIESLRKGWQKSFNGHLLVYADPKSKTDNPEGVPYLTEILWENGKAVAREVRRYEESNSADPEVFRRVLTGITEEYPAQSYGLVVLSHGSGWLPVNTLGNARSVINDGGREMEIRDFAAALPVKMSFIVFDVCLMGGAEVAYEFKDKADYLVISPAEVLVPGFIYETMMGHLMRQEPDVVAVAREFYEYYAGKSGLWQSATVSVVDVRNMGDLVEQARKWLNGIDGEKEVDIGRIQRFGFGSQYLYFDFGDYIRALYPQEEEKLKAVLDKCVVYKACTPRYYSEGTGALSPIDAFSGLTVYIPQAKYPYVNNEYRKMRWTREVGSGIP